MVVGVIFVGVLADSAGVSVTGVFALALGIAIQNFPEGAIISMLGKGLSRRKAFGYGFVSGMVVTALGGIYAFTLKK